MGDMISMAIHGITALLLVGLAIIYLSNYRRLKSKYTAGLLFFVLIFLAESVMALFFGATMVMFDSAAAEMNALLLSTVKMAGVGILLWISLE